MADISIRPITPQDQFRIYKWRNQKFVYEKGFDGQPVTWEAHERWFNHVFWSPDYKIFIIMDKALDIGQVRAQKKDGEAIISIYMPEQYTGKGYGVEAIKLCCEKAKEWKLPICAYFLPNNDNSKKAFRKAGFVKAEKDKMVLRVRR